MTTPTLTHLNGVNVEQLIATVNAVQQNPHLARFQFRAHNEWLGGGHSRTSLAGSGFRSRLSFLWINTYHSFIRRNSTLAKIKAASFLPLEAGDQLHAKKLAAFLW